jgi:transcriptional regulator with XRE-family HTH domain
MTTFGERLYQARRAQRQPLRAVGAAIGVSGQAVFAWEKGRALPSLDKVPPLARYLQVPPAWLAFGEG